MDVDRGHELGCLQCARGSANRRSQRPASVVYSKARNGRGTVLAKGRSKARTQVGRALGELNVDGNVETGLINGRWRVGKEIGEGSFGKVYQAVDVHSGEIVAVKMEFQRRRRPFLQREYQAYMGIRNTDTQVVGVVQALHYGDWKGRKVLVMDYLGQSLDDLMRSVGGRLSVKSVAMVGIQMLRRLQLIHHKGFLHRDIKPENMLMGRYDSGRVYLVDFGLAKRYLDYDSKRHIPFRMGLSFMGTSRYASLSAHRGWEQGRKDDVEALGFVLLYLLNGELPWQGLKESDQSRKWERVSEIKMKTRIQSLCVRMPELATFFRYIRALRFEQRPDYAYLRRLFRYSLKKDGYDEDRVFDWM